MDWIFALPLLLVSWILVGFATWVYIKRHAVQLDDKPAEAAANVAIVEALLSSLTEHPGEWKSVDGTLVHRNGTVIGISPDGHIVVEHEGTRSYLPDGLAFALVRAVQIRNARIMLDDLNPGKVN